jgi:hypothetical protein
MMGTLGSRSAVMLVLDGDSDLDLVNYEFFGRPQLLLSDLAQHHHVNALSIRLRGRRSNREGIGARVIVVLPEGRRMVQVMDGKSGYLSQSVLPLYFGLGEDDHASAIEVTWPSGERQTLPGPHPAGLQVQVAEP